MRYFLLFLCCLLPCTHAQALLIGTPPLNPPFETLADDQNHFFGFEIDLMSKICQVMKEKCIWMPVGHNELYEEIKAKKIDLAIAAIIITPQTQAEFLFSLPYLKSSAQFVTTYKSSINKLEDIQNKKVGVRVGTPFKELVLKLYENATVIDYPHIASLLEGLKANEVDIVLMNDEAAKYWVANNSTNYKPVGHKIPVGYGYGVMGGKENIALIAKVNQALLDMEADGSYLKIYSHYFQD